MFLCGGNARCWELEGAAWAPDGKRLAYGVESLGGLPAYDGLYVLDVATGKSRQIRQFDLDGERGGWYEIAWAPDGNTIAYVSPERDCCSGRGRINLIRPDGTGHTVLATGTAGPSGPRGRPTAAASPTQRHASGREATTRRERLDLRHAHRRNPPKADREPGNGAAWSPDRTRIAYLSGCGPPPFKTTKPTGIRIVSPAGRDLTHLTPDSSCSTLGVAGAPTWSPDGTKLAVANRQGVYVMDANGRNLRQLTTHAPTSIAGNNLSWSRPAWQPPP